MARVFGFVREQVRKRTRGPETQGKEHAMSRGGRGEGGHAGKKRGKKKRRGRTHIRYRSVALREGEGVRRESWPGRREREEEARKEAASRYRMQMAATQGRGMTK